MPFSPFSLFGCTENVCGCAVFILISPVFQLLYTKLGLKNDLTERLYNLCMVSNMNSFIGCFHILETD